MKTLLHICCAPCSVACIKSLQSDDIDIVGFWYNPNIHPYAEYKNRKTTLIQYAKDAGLKLILKDEYGLRKFIEGVHPDYNNRCEFCYNIRLNAAAKHANENGFDNFTTTLLISPYQNHEMICEVAKKTAKLHNTEFLYRDFRSLFKEGQQKSRELDLYMQKYCGCIFSEEQRYSKTTKEG